MEEILKEILSEMKATRKLLENAFGVQAGSVQQLGVIDSPVGTKKFSISQKDGVMLEQENDDGSWGNSSVRHICGYFSGLERWDHTYKGKPVVYLSLTINAEVPYNIRTNIENVFSRMLISIILGMSNAQLASVLTLTVMAGSTVKTVRMPEITDSVGSKVMMPAIKDRDWDKNAISYVDQAIAKIKAIQLGGQALNSAGKAFAAIAPSLNTLDAEVVHEPTQEDVLRSQIKTEAKAVWGDAVKTKVVEYSEKNLGGKKLDQLEIAQLQQYLKDLKNIKEQQEVTA